MCAAGRLHMLWYVSHCYYLTSYLSALSLTPHSVSRRPSGHPADAPGEYQIRPPGRPLASPSDWQPSYNERHTPISLNSQLSRVHILSRAHTHSRSLGLYLPSLSLGASHGHTHTLHTVH